MRLCAAIFGCATLTACSEQATEGSSSAQPEGWDAELALVEAVDLDPAEDVVELDLTARVAELEVRSGVKTPVWSYDGLLPGPMIRAKKGDLVRVHFDNDLPDATTIHWHGMRVPAAMDGAPGHSQPPVEAGGSFDYELVVPDAGLFWYHPHLDSAKQVGSGLYGAFLVEDPGEPEHIGDELVLVLSDMSIEPDGSLTAPDTGGAVGDLFGREGNTLLVNGRVRPTLLARSGVRQRWRIVNTSRTRYYQLALEGHGFTRIGGDGGFITEPETTERPLVVPGERADLVVTPQGTPGSELVVRWVPYDRGYGSTYNRPEEDLFVVRFVGGSKTSPPLPNTSRAIEPIDPTGAEPVDLEFTMVAENGVAKMAINGAPFPDAPPVAATVGQVQLWSVRNQTEWAHPFHLHGFFFQVVNASGAPLGAGEWKDTINVPVESTLHLLVDYDDRPGMWMFHCHILDHAERGMMGMLHLSEQAHP